MTSLVLTYLFHVLPALTSHSFAEMCQAGANFYQQGTKMFVTNLIFTLETTENDAWMPTLALGKLLNTFSREVGFGCFYESGKGF